MNQSSTNNAVRTESRLLNWLSALPGLIYRGKDFLQKRIVSDTVRQPRLNAHLQADIGLRDTRLTRRELAELERCYRRPPGAKDPLRHRIWTDYLD